MPAVCIRFLGLLVLTPALPLLAQTSAVLSGVVTDVGTPAVFTVNGSRIHCAPATRSMLVTQSKRTLLNSCPAQILGESVTVYGPRDGGSGTIIANEIDSEAPGERGVDGFAVIDAIIQPLDGSSTTIVSADGYAISIPGAVHPVFQAPLKADAKVATNLWLRYTGTQHVDGSVTATTVTLSQNHLMERERKATTKLEFDPASVTEENRQGNWSKAFRGIDPKRIPASRDAAMQQRVESIGTRLIPAYQRDLPSDDPARIEFRFQVVDQTRRYDATTLPNGIILIPEQVATRLENDSQLAAVLADNIASTLEKQELRQIPARRALTAGDLSLIAGGLFVPGLGLAAGVPDVMANAKMMKHAEEQSGRVSLVLLHQAGYDITEAPKVWWMLASLKPKPLAQVSIPYRARYLYHILATTWHAQLALPAAPADAKSGSSTSLAN